MNWQCLEAFQGWCSTSGREMGLGKTQTSPHTSPGLMSTTYTLQLMKNIFTYYVLQNDLVQLIPSCYPRILTCLRTSLLTDFFLLTQYHACIHTFHLIRYVSMDNSRHSFAPIRCFTRTGSRISTIRNSPKRVIDVRASNLKGNTVAVG